MEHSNGREFCALALVSVPLWLFTGGLLCGLLWELVNYWSRAKWHYSCADHWRT